MSLKAKIEAIIYASEEPVTLAQLISVLGQEALRELEELDQRQAELPLREASTVARAEVEEEADDQDALNAETLIEPRVEEDGLSEGQAEAEEGRLEAFAEGAAESEAPEVGGGGPESEANLGVPEAVPLERGAVGSVAEDGGPQGDLAEVRERKRQRDLERRLREYLRSVLDALVAEYVRGDRGLEIREVAGGYRFATKPEFHDAVRGFVRSLKPPLKLSLQALETLAVVAYRQPVTAPEVSEIRGVDSGGVLGSLMTRKLVTTAGRKQVIGRPILYKTTKEFLLRFGLKDVSELPSIEEFDRIAGELNEALREPVQEEMAMATATMEQTLEVEEPEVQHGPQADGTPEEPSGEAKEEEPEE